MAKSEENQPQQSFEDMSLEELQKEVLRVELQTKMLTLAQTKKSLLDFEAAEKMRREGNKRRMDELRIERETRARIVKLCRHRSGGTPRNILKGKGVGSFSILSRTLMPDGDTILIQCPRCRLKMLTPTRPTSESKKALEAYASEVAEFNRLLQESIEDGLEFAEMRGPTFTFKRDGVPFIPERV